MENGHDRAHIERHERTERILEAMAGTLDRMKDELRAFLTSQVLMGENLEKVAILQRETARELNELAKRTDEKFAETNDKLNALITFFEQHLREHGGGKRQG